MRIVKTPPKQTKSTNGGISMGEWAESVFLLDMCCQKQEEPPKDSINVTDYAALTGISNNAARIRLKVMLKAGLVERSTVRRNVYGKMRLVNYFTFTEDGKKALRKRRGH